MKTAIVHEWLISHAGSEKVMEQILNIFPEADLFSLVDFLKKDQRHFIKNKPVITSFIQNLPFAKNKFRNYFPLFPLAVEQFDLSGYDLIISSSHCAAKGVITGPDQLHICMCYSPARYVWDLQHQYLKESGLDAGIKSVITRYFLHKFRQWDYRTANGVNHFIAISHYIKRRIKKIYNRDSTVIYPNVAVENFELKEEKEDFYLTASRMVPYKKIDLIVKAFKDMPNKKLVVIGDGPQFNKIKSVAKSNVELMGYQPFLVLKDYMARAKAFIFAAEEDFGIVPVEAQACGTPVLAFGRGGAAETVVANKTGLFFQEQSVASLIQTINCFESSQDKFEPSLIREHSLRFSTKRFKKEFSQFIKDKTEYL